MTDRFPELSRLGDTIEQAAATQLTARSRQGRNIPRKAVLAVVVAVVAIPGLAYAASTLISSDEVAAGLPAGTKMLQGTDPRCTVVRQDVEYQCVLSRLPADPEVVDLKGTVEPTVDATKHVNGGCRSLTSSGRVWQCYIGQAAVTQEIIGPDFLGEYAPTPGVG
ncbi:MAG: hypothetical protein QOE13_1731 [Gaiellaceae bacterium]|jgi:hypothetical protein|nr:hypothetical protein [Gaiellaceae bacterium]